MNVKQIHELPALPPRPQEAHKGNFGRVLIVAGSRGMSGAACLSGKGALRGGAGLVTVAIPEELVPIVASAEPSYLTAGLAQDKQGCLSLSAQPELEALISSQSTMAIGPGWGQSEALQQLAHWFYEQTDLPLVIDADGLNNLSAIEGFFAELGTRKSHDSARILTPHPGEFARLLGMTIAEVQANREELAIRFAQEKGIVLLLKGYHTVITDGERIAINSMGNSGMATGGSGDVLTGLIAALLAQGMSAFEAAQLGAHLHGFAGDLAANDLSEPGMIASDLIHYLPQAWKVIQK